MRKVTFVSLLMTAYFGGRFMERKNNQFRIHMAKKHQQEVFDTTVADIVAKWNARLDFLNLKIAALDEFVQAVNGGEDLKAAWAEFSEKCAFISVVQGDVNALG